MRSLVLVFGCIALTSSACQTLLSIEQAQVDPELGTEPAVTESEADDEVTSEAPPAPDAGNADATSAEPAPQCEAFDNARVKLLNADGTLPPLPEAPSTPPAN